MGDKNDVRVIRGPMEAPRVYQSSLRDIVDGESYDVEIVLAIRQSNIDKLRDLAAHKSLNACNRFGESLLHMACPESRA